MSPAFPQVIVSPSGRPLQFEPDRAARRGYGFNAAPAVRAGRGLQLLRIEVGDGLGVCDG
jgi:hypothetical protein